MDIRKISIGAIFAALTFVVTYLTGFIRTPLPGGYLNVGDAVIFLAGILYGPLIGFIAGSIGSSLADLLYGSLNFAPGTFIIKGIEGLLVGLTFGYFKKRAKIFSMIVLFLGILILSITFYTFQQPNLTADSINSLYASSIIGSSFIIIGSLGSLMKKYVQDLLAINAMIIGGVEMVLGYYLYETFILQYVALLEVPLNAIQATVSLIVAFLIYKSLKRIA